MAVLVRDASVGVLDVGIVGVLDGKVEVLEVRVVSI